MLPFKLAIFTLLAVTAFANFNGTLHQKTALGLRGHVGTDCSQCTGDGPCAQCSQCVDMQTGPCAPCWSTDNAAGQACLPTCSECYTSTPYAINGRAKTAVKDSSCEAITDEATCMSSSEGDEGCAWCSSGAVGTSCQKASDAKALPAAVFECEYQTAYAAYAEDKPVYKKPFQAVGEADTDCSQCTGDGPCAQCSQCVDMQTGPCAPCWSTDNAAGQACLPTCSSCYNSNSYANGRTVNTKKPVYKKPFQVVGEADTDCSQCTGDGPCAQCSQCVDMQTGPCAPCWSTDNAAGQACLPTCSSCYNSNSYANGRTPPAPVVDTPKKLSSSAECSTYNYLKKAGFPSNTLGTMVCISKYESSWNCHATNKNVDGSTDYGLMQINSYYWCSGDPTSKYDECNASCSSLMDCQKNANCAYTVYKQQGYNAWYGYKNHKSECDSYTVNC